MGLDNYPYPYPCDVLRYPNAPGPKDCIGCRAQCPFKKIRIVRGIASTCCGIRGHGYSYLVEAATYGQYTLWRDLTYNDVLNVYNTLKDLYDRFAEFLKKDVREDLEKLLKYFELLIQEVEKYPPETKQQFRLKAWW